MSLRPQSPLLPSTSTLSDAPDFVVVHNQSSKLVKAHFDELQKFMGGRLASEPLNSQPIALERLTHLTTVQFQDLTIDVYDELVRRNNNAFEDEVPFLPVQDNFHPKRNEARQKLSILKKSRFKDLVGDVLAEFGRRYPEFQDPDVGERPHIDLPPSSSLSGHDPHPQKPPFISTTTPDVQDYVVVHMDAPTLAKIHFDELQRFRGEDLAKGRNTELLNSRSTAREKLTRLTKLQFQELTTDVYDELTRRNNHGNEIPFLSARDDIHPKRNQARRKLSTLPEIRFKDLGGDVLFELRRRYPEFHEPEAPDRPEVESKNFSRL